MKLLLDENLPTKLKSDFSSHHEVFTVNELGWNGKKNGELLGLLTFNGFDGLVTMDKNLRYQQNLVKFKIAIFIFNAHDNRLATLRPFVKKLEQESEDQNLTGIIEVSL